MSLRILHIADVLPTPNSGAAGTDYQGVLALQRAGHHVRAVWADELSHRINHYNLRYLLELPRSYREVMLRCLREEDFDVVQFSQPHGFLAAKALTASGSRTVSVHRSHGFEPRVRDELAIWHRRFSTKRAFPRQLASNVMSRLLERNNRLVARDADGHLVSASQCAEYLYTVYGVPSARVASISQGIPDDFSLGARNVDADRLTRMLHVSQYAFFKAPMILGEVVSKLLTQRPDLCFTWVCGAKHHPQALAHFAPEVRARISLVDWMPQDCLIDVYDRHGIFLFPSFFEGFGKAFLEAMSRGLVVVAADNGGMRDVITHGVDGFKVPTGDVVAMIQQVGFILNDLTLATAVSARSITTASQLSWDQFAKNCTLFYENLIRQKTLGVVVQGAAR